jgi:hypothetical protein
MNRPGSDGAAQADRGDLRAGQGLLQPGFALDDRRVVVRCASQEPLP